jgi:Tol biopolymer transport system component
LTQGGKTATTVQSQGLVNLWLVPEGDAGKAVRLPTGNVSNFFVSTGNNISWTPGDKIVYVSNESGHSDIWIADADGKNRKQLTANNATNVSPVATPDGRYIVFGLWQDGTRTLWRINIDGSNPVRLTPGYSGSYPAISPDSRWVIYAALEGANPTLWKMSIDGGAAVNLTDSVATLASVSPDGRFIAYLYPESPDPFAPPNRIAIIPFDGGPIIKTFNMSPSGTVATILQWSSDSKSVLYSVNRNNVSNIWSQPIEGGEPKQITNFNDLLITAFSWTRDGKQLACTRGTLLRDAILVTDLK